MAGSGRPSESDFLELAAADGLDALLHGAATAAPVKVGRHGVVGQSPDDQTFETALIETVTASFEQVFAEAEALMDGRYVEFVDLALIGAARARETECRIADDG